MSDQVLPETWAVAPLENVGSWGSGGTPSRKDAKAYRGNIPWLKIGDLPDGPVQSVEETITEHGLKISSAKLLPPATLLVAMYGSIGKLGITTEQCATNQAIAFCRPHEGFDLNYLFYLLMSERHRLMEQGQGGTQQNISQTILKAHEVPVAPESEQKRIVSKIDELFSRIDEGERALEQVSKLVERYRQSVLKAAVTGELTRDWREAHKVAGEPVESGEALLTRILTARREAWEHAELAKMKAKGVKPSDGSWKEKYKEPVAPTTNDLPELPEGWIWASVDQLSSGEAGAITDGPFGSKLKTEHYTDEGPRVVRLQNIKDGWFANEKAHISQERFATLEKHSVNAGDLLIAALGENPPRACVAPEWLGPAIVKADCIRARLSASVVVECICSFLNSPPSKALAKVIIHGVGRPRLNLGEIKSLVVPLCSTEEQQRICDLIAAKFSSLEHLSADIRDASVHSERLRQAILSAAFCGQLVSQDPSDEPASALLGRIASEAEINTAGRERGRKKKSA